MDPGSDLANHLQQVRDLGFCITDQELSMGLINLAVPLLSHSGSAVGALTIVSNRQQWPKGKFMNKVAPIAMETARMIMSV